MILKEEDFNTENHILTLKFYRHQDCFKIQFEEFNFFNLIKIT